MDCRSLLLFLLLSVSLTACAPLRPKVVGQRVDSQFAGQLMGEWRDRASQVTSLQGLAKVKTRAPGSSFNGTQALLAELPDHMRAETLSPFGSPLLILSADGEKLSVSHPGRNIFYTGAATLRNLTKFTRLPLNLTDLVELLLYRPQIIKVWKEDAYELQDGGWLLIRYGTLRRQELTFSPDRHLVNVSYFDEHNLILTVDYDQFAAPGEPFPHSFQISLPDQQITVSLEFSELETNGHLKPGIFTLTPPQGATIAYLDED